jgi:hypothetical protein
LGLPEIFYSIAAEAGDCKGKSLVPCNFLSYGALRPALKRVAAAIGGERKAKIAFSLSDPELKIALL